jgi:hypothetical protein
MNKKYVFAFAAFAVAVLCTSMAQAATTPTTGDLAYSWYDIAMNKVIGGPIGYTIGAGGVGYGIVTGMISSNLRTPIIATSLSAAWLGLNAIVSTMGAIY